MLFQKQIKITETDNGFVVEWSDEEIGLRNMGDSKKPSRGIEVYTKEKEMLARVGRFF